MMNWQVMRRRRVTWDRVQKLHRTAVWMAEHKSPLELFDLVEYFYGHYERYGIRLMGGPRCMWRTP